MACGGCRQRRVQLGQAARDVASGEVKAAAANVVEVGRTFGQDAVALTRAAGQKLAAAHARLKR